MAYREESAGGEGITGEARTTPAASPKPAENSAALLTELKSAEAQPKPVKRSKAKPIIFTILAFAIALGLYEGYQYWTTGRFMVTTDDAYVQADITILAAKVSGYVASVEVQSNQAVKAGDIIARIDDGDYRLALRSAEGKLATQRSVIDRIGRQIEAARSQVTQAEAEVTAARAEAVRAAADFERQQQLSQSNFASRATYDTAKAARDKGEANVASAQAALAAAKSNVDVLSAQKVEAERTADELQTAVDKAARDLSFTEVRAPVSGVIGNKAVEVGTWVQPGNRLAALVPLNSVHVDANFKETQLADLQPGLKVHIEVDAYPDRDITGTVLSLAPASGSVFSLLPPENATGNFTKIVQRVPVRVAVTPDVAEEGILRPGLSVVVRVDTREHADGSAKTANR
jgi:membrane fusion protein (multidrug efflux system)